MKGLTELQETKELWNLGDGLENVCNSVMRKLHHAGYVLEERNRTIINLDSYEVTAMIWAMNEYIHSDRFAEWDNDGRKYYQSVINEPNPDDYCSRAERKTE